MSVNYPGSTKHVHKWVLLGFSEKGSPSQNKLERRKEALTDTNHSGKPFKPTCDDWQCLVAWQHASIRT